MTRKKLDFLWHYGSPLGEILLSSDGEQLTGLWFEGQRYFAGSVSEQAVERRLMIFDAAARWLDIYFTGEEPGFSLPLLPQGTAFQQAVWRELLHIPWGQTETYGGIAQRLAHKTARTVSARTVGGAVGRNPISLMIPCHRVVGVDGNLTGYAGGLWRKEWLLNLERSAGNNGRQFNLEK